MGHLRSLQTEIFYQINTMSLEYDVRQDLRYLQGAEEAEAKAAAEAAKAAAVAAAKAVAAEAKAVAEAAAKAGKAVLNLLSKGSLTPVEIAEALEIPLEFVLAVQNKK